MSTRSCPRGPEFGGWKSFRSARLVLAMVALGFLGTAVVAGEPAPRLPPTAPGLPPTTPGPKDSGGKTPSKSTAPEKSGAPAVEASKDKPAVTGAVPPKEEATSSDTSEAETSETDTSEADTSETDTSEAGASEAETPEADTSEAETSKAEPSEPEAAKPAASEGKEPAEAKAAEETAEQTPPEVPAKEAPKVAPVPGKEAPLPGKVAPPPGKGATPGGLGAPLEGKAPAGPKEGGGEKKEPAPAKIQTLLPRSPDFKGERVDISPGEIEVLEFLRFLADYTGLPVIIDSTSNPQILKSVITIAAPMKGVTAQLVMEVLQVNKFLVTRKVLVSGEEVLNVESTQAQVPVGDQPVENKVLRVEPGRGAEMVEDTFQTDISTIRADEIATMVFTLQYTQPKDAITSLNNLIGGAKGPAKSKAFSIVDVQNSQMVIVTAKFGLLNYLQKLLSIIDVPIKEPERIVTIIDVENADADELTQLVQNFLQGRSGFGGGRFGRTPSMVPPTPGGAQPAMASSRSTSQEYQTNLIADWRTQKIIVETYSERDLEDINMLVRELDTRFDIRRLKTRIYQVRYLKADEVASDLMYLVGGSSYGLSGRAGLGTRTQGAGGASRTSRTRGVSRVGRQAGPTAGPTPVSPTGGAGGQGAPMPALIVPHVQTNSLIIQAEPEEYAEIMSILEQIDIKRRQVFLEAALVQVTTGSSLNYTIELLAGEPDDYATRLLFESSFGLSGLDLQNWNRTLPDLSAPGSVPAGALMAVMNRGKFPALVSFFKSNTDTEVLATPFILADDNQPNTIDIIETRFVQNTATGSSQVTTTSQEGEDAGITLEITPTISSQSAVFLEMSLEVSDFAQQGGSATLLPPKTTNSITSAVTIPDGEIFVIGGLTREIKAKSVSKVPIIGDIPLLGKLFRSESSSRAASNLYIFLRAHVLTHPEFADGTALTEVAMEFVHEFAPGLKPVRFEKPNVPRPPPYKRDTDEATRFKTRSQFSEGYEAPQGPYQSPEEGEGTREAPADRYRGDVESPYRGEKGGAERAPSAPVPRTVKDGTRSTSAAVPAAKPGAKAAGGEAVAAKAKTSPPQGGLESPPAQPRGKAPPVKPAEKVPPRIEEKEPPVEEATERSIQASLQRAGLELEASGQSWLVPARPSDTPRSARSKADSVVPPAEVDTSESWLGTEKK